VPGTTSVSVVAVVVRILVEPGDQSDHDRLESAVNSRIAARGGPPDGLMVHLGHPQDQGFVILDVWRTEAAFQAWWDELLAPALAEAGLHAGPHEITPVWSLARP
jgi:hypothetical protein